MFTATGGGKMERYFLMDPDKTVEYPHAHSKDGENTS